METSVLSFSLFSEDDVYLFRLGKHFRLYEKFGSRAVEGKSGIYFAVWAPFAAKVSVTGDFNGWNHDSHALLPRWDSSGIWEGLIPEAQVGQLYKYAIADKNGSVFLKGDPFAFSWEQNRDAASRITDIRFFWEDSALQQKKFDFENEPVAVYEMHLGSWMRNPEEPARFLSYREIAERLIPYLQKMQFTHVEFMPVMEHPFEPSWGYQVTGFYAANSRFGPPQDLMYLIDKLHLAGFGVILDWVPAHFPADANGLHCFDGTFLYEHEDSRKGFHPEWNTYIFNYHRPEVRSFLLSNAFFWLDAYHADGLRVDAVTSMLHLDYARQPGEWEPNEMGGNVNLAALTFLQELNQAVKKHFPEALMIAEESSDFPKLTHPVEQGGVGFSMKWMMGWMHDTLAYFKVHTEQRKDFHQKITFTGMYMFNEHYMIPLSHDEVVHGKASLIYKMPGDEWQKFANLRVMLAYMYTLPGANLLFMGGEFGQTREWRFQDSLDWHLLEFPMHRGLQDFVSELNQLYCREKALHTRQFSPESFRWVEADDAANSVFVYEKKAKAEGERLLIILNMRPQPLDYSIQGKQFYPTELVLNSDSAQFGGSDYPVSFSYEEQEDLFKTQLPPLAVVVLKKVKKTEL